jgi:HSP20 family protein
MTDKQQTKAKSTLLMTLVSALIIVVGIQTWFIAAMKQELDSLHRQTGVTEPDSQQTRPVTGPDEPAERPPQQPAQPPAASSPGWPQQSPFTDNWPNRTLSGRNWDPYQEIQRMQREMDRMFNDAFTRFDRSPDFRHLYRQQAFSPDIDLNDEGDRYVVLVDLPGAEASDISVHLEDQRLTISGKQDYEKQDTDSYGSMVYRERRSGTFKRSITLPEPVKQSAMQTKLDNGVLTITIPKAG